MIFDWAEQGVWVSRIRATLNRDHIPSPSGGLWDDTSVKRILHNVMYRGDLWLRKRYIDDNRKVRINNGEMDSWYITGNHPAIVTREQFGRVQFILPLHLRPPLWRRGVLCTHNFALNIPSFFLSSLI